LRAAPRRSSPRLGSAVLVGEVVSVSTGAGDCRLCLGILLMSMRGASTTANLGRATVLYALGTSAFIAAYTLVDGVGGRSAPSASSYTAWLFVLDGFSMGVLCLVVRGRPAIDAMLPAWRSRSRHRRAVARRLLDHHLGHDPGTHRRSGGLARIEHPVRGLVLSTLMLKEKLTPWRISAAVLILVGVG
jgi:drug/metabolite transporter (DMT)-like permease